MIAVVSFLDGLLYVGLILGVCLVVGGVVALTELHAPEPRPEHEGPDWRQADGLDRFFRRMATRDRIVGGIVYDQAAIDEPDIAAWQERAA